MKSKQKLHIATIGKCVGLFGELKLHLHTDFEEQFKAGSSFAINANEHLVIASFNPDKSLIKFLNFPDRTSASKLVNQKLFSTVEESLENCTLNEGEYFWFEMIGAQVIDDGDRVMGSVKEIERIGNTDYLIVATEPSLIAEKTPQQFYIPYIPQYIDHFDKESKTVYTYHAYDLLEAS